MPAKTLIFSRLTGSTVTRLEILSLNRGGTQADIWSRKGGGRKQQFVKSDLGTIASNRE